MSAVQTGICQVLLPCSCTTKRESLKRVGRKPGLVQVCKSNPDTMETDVGVCEFKASLGYLVRFPPHPTPTQATTN